MTKSTLASFRRSVQVGDVLRCVENTYRPEINGSLRRVTKNGPAVAECEMDGKSGFRMEWPKASDVVDVTATRITYRIKGEHTVTLERLEETR